jgi:hypothetical protein
LDSISAARSALGDWSADLPSRLTPLSEQFGNGHYGATATMKVTPVRSKNIQKKYHRVAQQHVEEFNSAHTFVVATKELYKWQQSQYQINS